MSFGQQGGDEGISCGKASRRHGLSNVWEEVKGTGRLAFQVEARDGFDQGLDGIEPLFVGNPHFFHTGLIAS